MKYTYTYIYITYGIYKRIYIHVYIGVSFIDDVSVREFLKKTPDPPNDKAVQNALWGLQEMGAILLPSMDEVCMYMYMYMYMYTYIYT